MRALARRPEQRFDTALEMAEAIEAATGLVAARKVGNWLKEMLGARLDERAAKVAEVESISSVVDNELLGSSDIDSGRASAAMIAARAYHGPAGATAPGARVRLGRFPRRFGHRQQQHEGQAQALVAAVRGRCRHGDHPGRVDPRKKPPRRSRIRRDQRRAGPRLGAGHDERSPACPGVGGPFPGGQRECRKTPVIGQQRGSRALRFCPETERKREAEACPPRYARPRHRRPRTRNLSTRCRSIHVSRRPQKRSAGAFVFVARWASMQRPRRRLELSRVTVVTPFPGSYARRDDRHATRCLSDRVAALRSVRQPGRPRAGFRFGQLRAFRQGAEGHAGRALDTGCPQLRESYRLDPAPGTLFTLAECERNGAT